MLQDKQKLSTRLVPNYRLLIVTGAILLVGAIASFIWYSYQTQSLGQAFLARASEFEDKQQYAEAAEYLHRYLRENPGEGEIIIRLAETYDKSVRHPKQLSRAVELYQRALGFADAENEARLRLRLGELFYRNNRLNEAEKQARKVLDKDSASPGGLRLLAITTLTRWQDSARKPLEIPGYPSLGYVLKEAIRLNPTDTELPLTLARIYRASPEESAKLLSPEEVAHGQKQLAQLADNLLDTLVEKCHDDANAWLSRYLYRVQYDLPDSPSDLDTAIAKGPNDLKVLRQVIDREMEKLSSMLLEESSQNQDTEKSGPKNEAVAKQIQVAERYLRKALKLNPTDESNAAALGRLLLLDGRREEAIAIWESCLEITKEDPSLHLANLLAATLITQGTIDDAEKALLRFEHIFNSKRHQLSENDAERIEALSNMMQGDFQVRCGNTEEAIYHYKQLLAMSRPDLLTLKQRQHVWIALGNAQASCGWNDLAAASYDSVESVLHVESPSALLKSAQAWLAANRPELAANRAKRSLKQAQTPEALFVLASALLKQQSLRPTAERTWSDLEKVIDTLEKIDRSSWPNPYRLALLKVAIVTQQQAPKSDQDSGKKAAQAILREAEKEYGKNLDALKNIALAYEEIGSPEDANRLVEQVNQQSDASPNGVILASQIALHRNENKAAREMLTKSLAAATTSKQKEAIEGAIHALDLLEGDPAKIKVAWASAHEKRPKAAEPILQLASLAIFEGDFEKAESWEKKLYEIEGEEGVFWRYVRAMRLIGMASTSKQKPARAIIDETVELLAKLQGLRQDWGKLELLDAKLSLLQNDKNRAIKKYQKALTLGEEQLEVHEQLVSLLLATGQLDKAQQHLDLIRNRYKFTERLLQLDALVHEQQGQLEEAEAILRKIVKANPASHDAQRALCSLLVSSVPAKTEADTFKESDAKKIKQTIDMLESLIQKTEKSTAEDYLLLGLAYEKQGNSQLADVNFQKAVDLVDTIPIQNPHRKVAILHAAGLHQMRVGKPEKGEAIFRQAVKIDPSMEQDLAITLLQQGRTDDAIHSYQRLLKHQPKNVIALNNLAVLLGEKSEQRPEALKYIEQAIALNESNKSLLDTKGILLVQSDRANEAVSLLEQVTTDENASAKDFLHLAIAYLKSGQTEKASKAFSSACDRDLDKLKLNPRDEEFYSELKKSTPSKNKESSKEDSEKTAEEKNVST